MVGFVVEKCTSFMYTLLKMVENWWSYSFQNLLGKEEYKVGLLTCFQIYIYGFVLMNGCIATPVVKRAPVNLWDLGSSPSGTLLFIYHLFFCFSNRYMGLPLSAFHFFYFCFLIPCRLSAPLAQFLFYFLMFILFVFLIYFPNTKKS